MTGVPGVRQMARSRHAFRHQSRIAPCHGRVIASVERRAVAAPDLNDLLVLGPIPDGICHMVESLLSDSFVAIRLLNADDNRLWYAATGGLPASYVEAFDGVEVGPTEGSCGTAAYRNEPVIVPDIDEDPAWELRRALASALGIRASWPTPIRSSDRHVLGTLAI